MADRDPLHQFLLAPAFHPVPVTGAEAHHEDDPLRQSWRHDLPASVVVALVALPLCLGIALASGAPLFSGIIAGVVGGLVVGALSGSALMVSGPAAGLTAIVVSAIATLGSYPRFLAAVVIGGVLQLGFGLVGAGLVGYYFPSAVIKGMLAAIGIILVLKQAPHAVGYDADFEGDESFRQLNDETTLSALRHIVDRVEPTAIVLSVLALALLFAWPRLPWARLRSVPAPLLAVVLGLAGNAFAATSGVALQGEHLVQLPVAASANEFFGLFVRPEWSAFADGAVWQIGLTLAIVASLETLLSLEATDRMDPYRREAPPNRELLAQGVGNVTSALLGGLPVTGVIVRSAANVAAGARTRWSAIMHGALLLVAVVAIPGALNRIPLAVLAAILIHTGWKLAHPRHFFEARRAGLPQLIPFLVTVTAILFTDLLVGITIGLVVGFFFIVLDQIKAPCYTVVSPPGSVLTRLRLHEHISFLHKAGLATMLDGLARGSRLELDGTVCKRIDHDVLELIHDFVETAALRGIDYRLVAIPPLSGRSTAH
ncbi:MAG: SulP family inorganic anion transporter [Gemmatimonadaceae bacterium]|nr:SulP family inorganic anion transporter [Gemmatimonadaceae bacterium]